jgi:hypothetical protein
MKQLAKIGIYMNFTYDEPSAVGVDPALVYEAVRAIGVEHTILSMRVSRSFRTQLNTCDSCAPLA